MTPFAENKYTKFKKQKEIFMKATGIVRRIDDCVIIRQKPINRINTGFFNGFCPKIFEKQYI